MFIRNLYFHSIKKNIPIFFQPLYNTCRSVETTTITNTNLKSPAGTLGTEPQQPEQLEPTGKDKTLSSSINNNVTNGHDTYHYSTARPTIAPDDDNHKTPQKDLTEIPPRADTPSGKYSTVKGDLTKENYSSKTDSMSGGYSTVKDINMPSTNSRLIPLANDPTIETDSLNGFYSTVNERDQSSYSKANQRVPPSYQHSLSAHNSTEDTSTEDQAVYSTANVIDNMGSSNDINDDKQGTLNYYSIPIDEGPKIPLEIQQQYAKVNKKK